MYINHKLLCTCDIYNINYCTERIWSMTGKLGASLAIATDLGEVNNHLLAFERSVASSSTVQREPAKSMLTFMVKGLFTPHKFPYVHFSGTKTTGDNIFPLFWEVV